MSEFPEMGSRSLEMAFWIVRVFGVPSDDVFGYPVSPEVVI